MSASDDEFEQYLNELNDIVDSYLGCLGIPRSIHEVVQVAKYTSRLVFMLNTKPYKITSRHKHKSCVWAGPVPKTWLSHWSQVLYSIDSMRDIT